ncbi:MAG: NADH:flavin oxidoreductase [Deltaproteobacteria bacterium]|nr:NADH:flavin oxidoreductase [Deltaproteobacteria bacterium]
MTRLFEKTEIRGMKIANRFVRSATWEGMASEEGACTPQLVDLMCGLAAGGVGLIITGHTFVRSEGKAATRQLGISSDAFLPGLRHMTDAVHPLDGKIVLQLAHGGLLSSKKLTGLQPVGPSIVEEISRSQRASEMTVEDIHELVSAYGKAAARARAAGFEGVQIHAAHGYLLSQFLSPFFNRRQDAYGGNVPRRAKILVDVQREIRKTVGDDYPVLVKLNSRDFIQGGLDLEASLETALILQDAGIDAIELSGGTLLSGELSPSRRGIETARDEAYFKDAAEAFKAKLKVPLILVGGIRSFEVADELVRKGITDYISMSRPFIREPGLVRRWQEGDRRQAACVSDNRCFKPALLGDGLYCVTDRDDREKAA